MKTIVATAIAVTIAGMILTVPVVAQQPGPGPGNPPAAGGSGPGSGWGPGMIMGPGIMGWGGRGGMMAGMCDPRGAGMAEWRMERIQRLIKLTDPQKTALEQLRTASTKAAESIAAACPREFPASATARMELMEKRLDAMLVAVKTVRPAFDAFYATLDNEQKARIDRGGPRRWGWQGWWRGN